jgi:hypothetical protein
LRNNSQMFALPWKSGPSGVQFHDILYKTFRDILYTPARRWLGLGWRNQPRPEDEGWLGERATWKSNEWNS